MFTYLHLDKSGLVSHQSLVGNQVHQVQFSSPSYFFMLILFWSSVLCYSLRRTGNDTILYSLLLFWYWSRVQVAQAGLEHFWSFTSQVLGSQVCRTTLGFSLFTLNQMKPHSDSYGLDIIWAPYTLGLFEASGGFWKEECLSSVSAVYSGLPYCWPSSCLDCNHTHTNPWLTVRKVSSLKFSKAWAFLCWAHNVVSWPHRRQGLKLTWVKGRHISFFFIHPV